MLTARLISRSYSSDLNLDYSSEYYLSGYCDYLMPSTSTTQLGYVPAETDDKDYYQHEYSYTNFDRSYTLPSGTNVDQISAVYIAGILSIDVPVSKNKNESKRIINIK